MSKTETFGNDDTGLNKKSGNKMFSGILTWDHFTISAENSFKLCRMTMLGVSYFSVPLMN
jgi:hypothetical protein